MRYCHIKDNLYKYMTPKGDLFYYGLVVNNHINNINGEELLIPPQIVGKEYWTRGYFYNVEHYNEKVNIDSCGFYSIGKRQFVDEYGNEITNEPELLGMYGVATITGIARKINRELIIAGII